MSEAVDKARDAVADAAVEICGRLDNLAAPEAGTVLKAVAEAVSAVAFGPDGGEYTQEQTTDYRYSADYHYTTHAGEDRERSTGFSAP